MLHLRLIKHLDTELMYKYRSTH